MPATTNINNSFFQGFYKDAWRELIPAGLTEVEVDFIVEISHLEKGAKVLDLMCGYGRHALELGRRGIEVTAVDNLEDYVTEINEAARQNKLHVEAIQADILHYEPREQFDAAICMGNSFAFFDKNDEIKILKKVSRHLSKGGIMIINSWTIAEIAIRYFKEKDWHYAGDFKCLIENFYLFNPARIESEQTIISKDGNIELVKGVDFIFTITEMEEMFKLSGFRIKYLYSTPRKRKFVLGDGRIYIVAEKI